jgi:hypothetical protein
VDVGEHISWFTECTFTSLSMSTVFNIVLPQHADNAQQAFSSDNISTLHLAIPALESLYRAWSSRADHVKYSPFAPAVHAACEKINEYYEKTTQSLAYIMAMSMNLCSYPAHC